MLADSAQLPLLPDAPAPRAPCVRCPTCRRPLSALAARRAAVQRQESYRREWDAEMAAHPEDEAAIEAKARELIAIAGRPIGMAKVFEALRGTVAADLNNSYRASAARRLMGLRPDLAGWLTTRDTAGSPAHGRTP